MYFYLVYFGLRCICCLWVVYVRGDTMFYDSFIVSCFTFATLVVDLYRLFMVYVLFYVL